jgi:hypothetical protein
MWEQCKEHGEERSARTIAAYQQFSTNTSWMKSATCPVDEITTAGRCERFEQRKGLEAPRQHGESSHRLNVSPWAGGGDRGPDQ